MNEKRSGVQVVLRNAFSVTVASCFANFLLGITGLFIVRYLGLSLYSEYSTAMLFMAMFGILGRLGLNRVCLRESSRDISQTSYYYGAALLLNGSLMLIGFVIALLTAYFKYDTRIFTLTVLLGTSLFCMSLKTIPLMVFQSYQKMHLTAIVSVISSCFYACSFFVAIWLDASVFVLASLHLCMNLINFSLSSILSLRITIPRFRKDIIKRVLYIGRHFCVISVMTVLYSQSYGFLLAWFNIGNEVGIYNAAFRFYSLLQMVAHTIDTAISPAIYSASRDVDRIIRGVKLAIRYFVAPSLLLGAIMSGRAEWFMVTMFKEEFHESTYVLELLGIAIVFRLVIFLLSHIIYAQDHERFMAKAMTFLAAFSFGGSILLIPRFGAIAAASVFLASESLMAMICFYKSERVLGFPRLWRMLVLPVIGGLLSYVVLVCSSSYALAGMFGSVLVFFGFLFIFRFYSYVEVLWLFKLLTKFKQAKGSEKT